MLHELFITHCINEGWLRKDGSNLNSNGTSYIINISTQYIRSTCITPPKNTHILSKINDDKNKTKNLYKILKSLTKLKDDNPVPSTESPSDLPNNFLDFFLNKKQKPKNSFRMQIHINHTIGNIQNSLVLLHWKKWNTQHHQKNESNNLYRGPLQYQISTIIQGHNLRCHHHHC